MSTPAPASHAPDAPGQPGRRLSRAGLGAHLRVPLYREGYALVLNSVLVSLFGVVYWLLAAHYYEAHVLGLNSAAISAMMFLAGISQLNLMSALMRFIPVAGRDTTRFVLSSYLLSVCIGGGVALFFLLGLGTWASALGFLTSSPGFVLWFVGATMAWCVFNLQDSVLTGLRAAVFVPLENLVYSIAKIALLVALVEVSPHYGIFASWTAALLASLVPVNLLIYGRLLRRRVQGEGRLPGRRQLARFVSADYVGALFWLSATMLMPVIVTAIKGATANAYFSLAWLIALPLLAVSASTGASLVVTGSGDEARLPTYARRVLIQTAAIVIPLALLLALASTSVLSLFGGKYATHSSTTLTLLALSAIPNVVNALYLSVYRVQRRMSRVITLLGFQCGIALVLGIVLLEVMGIVGIGVAWLVAQSVVAATLLLVEPQALLSSPDGGRSSGSLRKWAADLGLLAVLVRLRHGPANLRRSRKARRLAPKILASISAGLDGEQPAAWTQQTFLPTVSDMSVITAGPPRQSPRAVIKMPTTTLATAALRRESDVLATLNSEARLGDWRDFLPTVLASGQIDDRAFVIQRSLPGIPASRMVEGPDGGSRVLTAAAATIGELHRRTASSTRVEADALERWVDGPSYVVRQLGAAFAGRAAAKAATERLAGELHDALRGRAVPVGWIHGDFVPSNILMSAWGASVVGIVDWELAGPAELPPLDVIALLLATRAHQRRQEIGELVLECARRSPWTEFEQDLLDSSFSRLPGAQVDSRTLALLWWLRHVAGNLAKSTRYARSRLWVRWNVLPVLDVFEPR
jgi:aminoglycoside phosphotransferase (APT) family kinase protein/O-antigen/teichoic acid export membrane protein